MNPISIILLLVGIGVASISSPLNPGYGFTPEYWPALVGLMIASSGYIYFQAEKHAEIQKSGKPINHWLWNAQRFVVAIIFISVIHAYNFNLAKEITLLIFGMAWFGFLFNLSKNHFSFVPWDYIGKPGKNQAITDSIFSYLGKQGGKILILVELAGMAVSGWVYCLR